MASTKYKLFQGTDPATLEKDINAWLSDQSSGISVSRSETAFAAFGTKAGERDIGLILVSVWYSERSR